MNKTFYYKTFEDDVISSKEQDYHLDDNYKWIMSKPIDKLLSKIIYFFGKTFGFFYSKVLGIEVINSKILEDFKNSSYFIYGNHTQELGDVFVPAYICKDKRIFTLGSQSNLGIPVIGKLLPYLGIIPTPKNVKETKKMLDSLDKKISNGNPIIIYPEAHLWPYYTQIRPFDLTSFKFPTMYNIPCFCMTTVYTSKQRKKPKIKMYIDGPFYVDNSLSKKEQIKDIHDQILDCMKMRAKLSDFEYVKYVKR